MPAGGPAGEGGRGGEGEGGACQAAGDGSPVQLLYRLSSGPSGPRDESGAQLVQMFKKELRKAEMLLDNEKFIQNSKLFYKPHFRA